MTYPREDPRGIPHPSHVTTGPGPYVTGIDASVRCPEGCGWCDTPEDGPVPGSTNTGATTK